MAAVAGSNDDAANTSYTTEELNDLIFYFRSYVVDKKNKSLKEKLRTTIKMRDKILKEADFADVFAFFFIKPKLVRNLFTKKHFFC